MVAVPIRSLFFSSPAPPVATSTEPTASVTGFQRAGYAVLIVYLFLIYSRIFDVKASSLHIPGISYRIMMLLLLLSGAFRPALKHPIGKALLFMTIWFMAAIPTSLWRGGSLQTLLGAQIPAFVIYLSTAGLLVEFEQCRRAAHTVGWAFLVLTLIALIWGSTETTGRLFLPNGKFANPNEMAQALLLGLPLWGLIFLDTTSFVKKAFALGVLMVMILTISKTGSRGALIALAVLLLVMFMRAPLLGKLKLVVGGFVVLALIVAIMPGKLLRRYTTFTEEKDIATIAADSDYDATLETSAITSVRSRQELLKKSIKFTLQHPLFGVGPSMFAVAEDFDAKANGLKRGAWQGTHNSYTQVSSEIGIPGALAYLAAVVLALKRSSGLYNRTRGDPRLRQIGYCAICVHFCLVIYAVTVFFDYIAYTSMLSVFAGLTAAMEITVPREIERLTSQPAVAEVPFEQFRPGWRTTTGVPQQV